MNKIASIERILDIVPHPNGDRIEVAKILGYECVVKKGEFKAGDLVVYIEPDSIIDDFHRHIPSYQFLEIRGWRIREAKFRGVHSAGLILPLSLLNECGCEKIVSILNDGLKEGVVVAEAIGVRHFERPLPNDINAEGHFPSFLTKTDETNLRSNPRLLEKFWNQDVYITVKQDGQSLTAYFKDGEFGVCSRNLKLKEGNNNFWTVVRKYKIEEALRAEFERAGRYLCLQGESCGPGIQKNPIGLSELTFFAFNLYDINKRNYLSNYELDEFCKRYSIPQVPLISILHLSSENYNLNTLIELANMQKYPNGSYAEGIVIRPLQETYINDKVGRLSGKIISENYKQE